MPIRTGVADRNRIGIGGVGIGVGIGVVGGVVAADRVFVAPPIVVVPPPFLAACVVVLRPCRRLRMLGLA